jgi:hypothetical protein
MPIAMPFSTTNVVVSFSLLPWSRFSEWGIMLEQLTLPFEEKRTEEKINISQPDAKVARFSIYFHGQ